MGQCSSTALWSRPIYFGVVRGTHAPKNRDSAQVATIESSMQAKLSNLQSATVRNFTPPTRVSAKDKAAAALVGGRSETRSSTGSGTSSAVSSLSAARSAEDSPDMEADYSQAVRNASTHLFFDDDGDSGARRRLHIEDAAEIHPGHEVLLVVPEAHPNFEDYIALDNSPPGCVSRTFNRGSKHAPKWCVQLLGKVTSNPSGYQLLRGLGSGSEKADLIGKGAGLGIVLVDCPGKTFEVQFKSIAALEVEMWDLNPERMPPRDYGAIFPKSGNGLFANFDGDLDQLISEVWGDASASLRLIAAFRAYKQEVTMQASRRLSAGASSSSASSASSSSVDEMYRDGTMRESLEKEMVEAGVPFAESLERRAKAAFAEQNQFTPFCKQIFDWDATIEEAKNKMPKHWTGLCTSSSDRSLAETGDESKDSFKLLTLVGTIRHRNKHLLSFFASIPAMANEAKGESNNASAFERHMRVQVGSTYVAEFFNSEFDGAVARQKELFSKQPVLEMVYDNYQKYLKLKSQRGARSALPQEGTARNIPTACYNNGIQRPAAQQ